MPAKVFYVLYLKKKKIKSNYIFLLFLYVNLCVYVFMYAYMSSHYSS